MLYIQSEKGFEVIMEEDKKVILLVEDDLLSANLGKKVLNEANYHVIICNNAKSAIELVNQNPGGIDLILMDIDLGEGLDGTEAARQILSEHDLPIIFLSNHTESEFVNKTLEIASYGYVLKNQTSTTILASIKMAFNIFELKKEEKVNKALLEASEKRYKSLVEDLPEIIYSISFYPDMKFDFINQKVQELNFASAEDLYHDPNLLLKLIHPDDKSILEESFIHKKTNPYILRWINKNRKVFYLEHRNHYILEKNGSIKTIEGIAIDITEKIDMSRKLKEQEEKYKLIIENMSDGVAEMNKNIVTYLSPAYSKILGYSQEEIEGANKEIILSKIHPEDLDRVKKTMHKAYKNRTEHVKIEYRAQKKDGNYVWFEDNIRIEYNENNEPEKSYINTRDVTKYIEPDLLKKTKKKN